MGICKCKKRSEDFCYQHKKFICDDCVSTDHPVCYINSYVNWLRDSEFEEPLCEICKDELTSENSVRLLCYHIYHPECIDVYANSLPPTTASAGYVCPTCSKQIIPNNDVNGPLALNIKKTFSISPWAETILHSYNTSRKINSDSTTSSITTNVSIYNNSSNSSSSGNGNNLINTDFYNPIGDNQIKPISPSLLEETSPLNHLNSNPYGLAIRKQQQLQQHLPLSPAYSKSSSNINNNSTLGGGDDNGDSIIQFDDNHIQEEDDKYNKKITLSSYYSNHILPTIKEKPIHTIVIIILVLFLLYLMFRGGNEQENDSNNIEKKNE